MAQRFAPLAKALTEHEATIVAELNGVQGSSLDLHGYYHPSSDLLDGFMRPSSTLNDALASLSR